MKRLILLLVLFAICFPAAGQVTTATLGGRVCDSDGPLEGVTVVAIHQQTNSQYYATTDRGGWYQMLDLLPGGPYTVRIHYFEYKPVAVRNLYLPVAQNTVVDADVEAGESRVYRDEAATSMRVGEAMVGGEPGVSPLIYDIVGQRTYTSVPFDVRQKASLDGVSMIQVTPVGSSRFHASAYGYLPASTGHLGMTLSTPLASEDYQLFAGLQYDNTYGLTGSGRFDARFDSSNRLDVTGGRIPGSNSWAAAGLTTSLAGDRASNRVQAGWYGRSGYSQMSVSDDFSYAAGRQRLLFGVSFENMSNRLYGSSASSFDFYLQDAVRLGTRLTIAGGVSFSFPFTFSPRVSAYYDLLGNGAVVFRGGTAVYGRNGRSSTWKSLAAVDLRLPARFILSLEGEYGQEWERLFIISPKNTLDSRHAATARLERPLSGNAWAVASYTLSDGSVSDKLIAGFWYKAEYLNHFATTLSVLYKGYNLNEAFSPASISWYNSFEARLSQDVSFTAASRTHTLQLTAYYLRSPFPGSPDYSNSLLAGLKYYL